MLWVLLTFPSRYWFTVGLQTYLALRDGPRGFGQDCTCPALLRYLACHTGLARKGLSPAMAELSRTFRFGRYDPVRGPTTPELP